MRWAVLLLPLVTSVAAGEIPTAQRQSGRDAMSAEIRALQENDRQNPGMLWVAEGARLWTVPAIGGPACAGCHGDASRMRGVAAAYPAYSEGRLMTLEARINACRSDRQKEQVWPHESRPLLAMSAFVAHQSRGMAIAPRPGVEIEAAAFRGKALFTRRMGQLNLSCAGCHDDNWGRKLGASTIPQGHATGYPIYRLEWQGLGSLQRRLRNCLTGVRAEAYPFGADELVDLEAYLAARAAGMAMETPAVRP